MSVKAWVATLPRHVTRARVATLVAVALLGATVFPVALARPIDGDEGFFLIAARLFSRGLAPYRDFFFIHAPAVPYVFGAWFRVFGPGWYTARVLSGLIGVGVGMLVFEYLRRATSRDGLGLLGVLLYAASGLVLGWFTPVKTLGISCLFTFGGVCALARGGRRSSLVAGVLLGLGVSARLYLVVALPCALLHLLRRERLSRAFLREVALLAAGAVIGLLPLLIALVQDRQALFFGTVEYHALRDVRSAGAVGDWPQKLATLLSVLGLEEPDGPGSIQLLGLVTLALASLVSRATPRNSPFAPVWLALFVTSLLPTPAYPQYFALLVPFLVVEAVLFLATLPARELLPAIACGLLCYGALGYQDARRYLVTGAGVPGLWSHDRLARWSIPHIRAVGRAIDEQHRPLGASWWPGYFVGSRTPIAVDLANDFGMVIADKIPEARRRRFHIVSHQEVAAMIHRHAPPLFVEGNWAYRPVSEQLPANGYVEVWTSGPVKIWTAP
jgi:hypothetical protein